MKPEQEFYIGWQQSAPPATARAIKHFVHMLALVMAVFAAVTVVFQRHISNSIFEFGQTTTLTGVLTFKPVPMLILPETGRRVLLVSAGKFGGEKVLERVEARLGEHLVDKPIVATGSLIYHDGKTVLELHDARPADLKEPTLLSETPTTLGHVALRGEITDPKCYFGVMKPAVGKPHQDCTARCLAGGIPPVLKVANAAGDTEYYLMKGADGETINELVAPFAGGAVEVRGELRQWGDWLAVYIDPASLRRIQTLTLNPGSMCR
ncbi:MAG: hypothetical protein SFV52_05275 [Saprospiraceae bacterium]|nr:hypothetical protein [Saprospiraceae bacterium]